MSKKIKILFSLVLTLTVIFTSMIPASASGRRVSYLSELHLAEADTAEEAKQMLTDGGFTVIENNLNPEGDKVVYLGYKTSNDVEDAITDISVMNMNGGFNITDYQAMLEESFNEYRDLVVYFRTAANEFAKNYKAGKKEALLAYTQLNYYYTEEAEIGADGEAVVDEEGNAVVKKIKMGDYMLAFPEKDEDFADILMKGNTNILNNMRSLLAMGVGKGSIVDRIKTAAEDEAVFSKIEYYDLAKNIATSLNSLKGMKENAQANYDMVMADENLTEEEKANLAYFPQQTLATVLTIETMLSKIPYGDSDYCEYITSGAPVDYSAFYPFVEVMTAGQRALIATGQFIPVMIYDEVELTQEEIDQQLAAVEKSYFEQSVYLGTDMEMYEGSIAVTKGAITRETTTGNCIFEEIFGSTGSLILTSALSLAGAVIATASIIYLVENLSNASNFANANAGDALNAAMMLDESDDIASAFDMVLEDTVSNNANTIANTNAAANTGGAIGISLLTTTLGLIMLAVGVYNLVALANSYNVEYTDIPLNMVENVETENGDRYIRYSVVNSYYNDGGEIATRAGDTNAYDGQQWNAIYYTKSYEAGKCMLATNDFPTSEADFGSYSPVHPFGTKDICYNLNDFSSRERDEEKVFLAFGNSNNKKAAATSVPSIVGSVVSYGFMGVSGVAGVAAGMILMSIIKSKKQGKKGELVK